MKKKNAKRASHRDAPRCSMFFCGAPATSRRVVMERPPTSLEATGIARRYFFTARFCKKCSALLGITSNAKAQTPATEGRR